MLNCIGESSPIQLANTVLASYNASIIAYLSPRNLNSSLENWKRKSVCPALCCSYSIIIYIGFVKTFNLDTVNIFTALKY